MIRAVGGLGGIVVLVLAGAAAAADMDPEERRMLWTWLARIGVAVLTFAVWHTIRSFRLYADADRFRRRLREEAGRGIRDAGCGMRDT